MKSKKKFKNLIRQAKESILLKKEKEKIRSYIIKFIRITEVSK